MHTISPLALHHVQTQAPQFIEQVQRAKASVQGTRNSARLVMSLDLFEDDPFLLYSCLWYACSEGVDVVFSARR